METYLPRLALSFKLSHPMLNTVVLLIQATSIATSVAVSQRYAETQCTMDTTSPRLRANRSASTGTKTTVSIFQSFVLQIVKQYLWKHSG